MEKNKIYSKIFWRLFLALLFGFMALYISSETGYYEFEQHKKVTLTTEKIKEFEQDLKEGKTINVKDYLDEKEENYENTFSKAGIMFSTFIGDFVQNGVTNTFKFLNNVFDG